MDAMTAIEKLAESFAKASQEHGKITLATLQAESLIPRTLEEAMAAQRAFAESWAEPVAGWKLAIRPDGEAIGAPMFDCVRVDDANAASFPHDGTEGIEVEICFTLSADIPAATSGPLTRADLIRYIDKVHLGAELLRYRLAEKNQVPFPLFLADRLANHGFVIGPEVDKGVVNLFAGNGENLPQLTVTEGPVSLFDATVEHPNGDPLAPLVTFANTAFNKGDMLKAGNVITTGSLCGAIPSTLARETHITLKSVGAFTLSGPKP
ncbi:2-keto-4-pentenoate hydratase [Agrobacterium sp. LC34]|nr:2-keto-4-pentenoate hydratase [Agrobacterium sp. LC34]